MKNLKRILTLLLAICMMLTVLAGCGDTSTDTNDNTVDNTTDSTGDTAIRTIPATQLRSRFPRLPFCFLAISQTSPGTRVPMKA